MLIAHGKGGAVKDQAKQQASAYITVSAVTGPVLAGRK
jgi:hypothetical protein